MSHETFIFLHAAAAVASFGAGCMLIFLSKYRFNKRLFGVYWAMLIGMVVFLTGAMIVHWAQYSSAEQLTFAGLFVLGFYMLYRAFSASQALKTQTGQWRRGYINHIGFTLISLLEGFLIVTVIRLGAPEWLVILTALLGLWAGRAMVASAEKQSQKAYQPA